MKKIILTLFCAISFSASAQYATIAPGLVSNQTVGTSGLGRPDAQIEANNANQQGHALISIFQTVNPGVADREGALDYEAYDSVGVRHQLGAISYMWVNPNQSGGYAVARHEVNTVLGSGEIPMRLFGNQQGITLFGANGTPGDHDPAGGPFLRITRTQGLPSIAGKDDLVLQGKVGGGGITFVNPYPNPTTGDWGNVVIGGELRLLSGGSGCPASVPSGVTRCIRIISSDGYYSYLPEYR